MALHLPAPAWRLLVASAAALLIITWDQGRLAAEGLEVVSNASITRSGARVVWPADDAEAATAGATADDKEDDDLGRSMGYRMIAEAGKVCPGRDSCKAVDNDDDDDDPSRWSRGPRRRTGPPPAPPDKVKFEKDWKKMNCFCDDLCALYGDCCVDADAFDPDQQAKARLDFDCVALKQYGDVYLRHRCPNEFAGRRGPGEDDEDDEDRSRILAKCENPDVDADPFGSTPVTNKFSGITYSNYYCALCNRDSVGIQFWGPRLECPTLNSRRRSARGFSSGANNVSEDYVVRNLQFDPGRGLWGVYLGKGGPSENGGNGSLEASVFHECYIDPWLPDTVAHLVRQCPGANVVASCPAAAVDDGLEATPDDDAAATTVGMEKLCHAYTALVFEPATTYRNVHCALCNNVSVDSLICLNLGPFGRFNWQQNFNSHAFAVLLDVGGDLRDKVGFTAACKRPEEVYDPFFRKCRNVFCGGGGGGGQAMVYRNGRCLLRSAADEVTPSEVIKAAELGLPEVGSDGNQVSPTAPAEASEPAAIETSTSTSSSSLSLTTTAKASEEVRGPPGAPVATTSSPETPLTSTKADEVLTEVPAAGSEASTESEVPTAVTGAAAAAGSASNMTSTSTGRAEPDDDDEAAKTGASSAVAGGDEDLQVMVELSNDDDNGDNTTTTTTIRTTTRTTTEDVVEVAADPDPGPPGAAGKSGNFTACPKVRLSRDEFSLVALDDGDGDEQEAFIEAYNVRLNRTDFEVLDDQGQVLVICAAVVAGLGGDRDGDPVGSRGEKFGDHMAQVTLVLLGVSIVCLVVHVAVALAVPELHNLSGKNLVSLSVALLGGYSSFIAVMTLKDKDNDDDEDHGSDKDGPATRGGKPGCVALAVFTYYFFLASFFWMLAIAIDICRTLRLATRQLRVVSGSQWKRFAAYSLLGWAAPLGMAGLTLAVEFRVAPKGLPEEFRPGFGETAPGGGRLCWFSNKKALLVYFVAPFAGIMGANALLFSYSARLVCGTAREVRRMQADTTTTTSSSSSSPGGGGGAVNIHLYLRLAVIMGLTWTVGLAAAFLDNPGVWYAFVVLNTLQGLFIFLAFTCTPKVAKALRERFRLLEATSLLLFSSSSSSSALDGGSSPAENCRSPGAVVSMMVMPWSSSGKKVNIRNDIFFGHSRAEGGRPPAPLPPEESSATPPDLYLCKSSVAIEAHESSRLSSSLSSKAMMPLSRYGSRADTMYTVSKAQASTIGQNSFHGRYF